MTKSDDFPNSNDPTLTLILRTPPSAPGTTGYRADVCDGSHPVKPHVCTTLDIVFEVVNQNSSQQIAQLTIDYRTIGSNGSWGPWTAFQNPISVTAGSKDNHGTSEKKPIPIKFDVGPRGGQVQVRGVLRRMNVVCSAGLLINKVEMRGETKVHRGESLPLHTTTVMETQLGRLGCGYRTGKSVSAPNCSVKSEGWLTPDASDPRLRLEVIPKPNLPPHLQSIVKWEVTTYEFHKP